MKKILFTALFASVMLGASAENSIGFVPTKVVAGANNNWVQISLNNEINLCSVAFDIHLPLGFSFYSEGTIAQVPTNGSLARAYNEDDDEPYGFSSMYNQQVGADGHNYVRVVKGGMVNIKGNSGPLFRTRLVVDNSVAPGIYPVTFTAFSYNGEAATTERWKQEDKVFTSYVIVGEPNDQTLEVVGEIPNFVNAALATETAIKTLDLTEATASYGDFTYVAGRKVVAPATDVNASVKFDAPLAGTYGSFCAPVDVNVDCYEYSKVQDGWAIFTPATTAPANTPVLISEAVKTDAQAAVLKTVEGRQITKGYYVANDGSGMRSVNGNATIPALRGAWEDIVASSNLRIAIETPTGLQYIGTADEVFGNTYDLQGRQVENAHNGVFVVNGKKQFVK